MAKTRKPRKSLTQKKADFLKACPDFHQIINAVETGDLSAKNPFIQDIYLKFNTYGKLSDKQVEAVLKALERNRQWNKEKIARKKADEAEPKGPAPSGKVSVRGTVLTVKWKYTQFGSVAKMLIKLDNNSKVWVSCPSSLHDAAIGEGKEIVDFLKGRGIELKATFTVSNKDPHFSFGSRPVALTPGTIASETIDSALDF